MHHLLNSFQEIMPHEHYAINVRHYNITYYFKKYIIIQYKTTIKQYSKNEILLESCPNYRLLKT